jgi:deoxyadenosine/deoxycytidine kinase
MEPKHKYVAVAGNIGVGKTTLVELLCKNLNWEPFFEPMSENPYLVDFYKDMEKWAFHSQISFLIHRLRIHHSIINHPNSVFQDRSVYEDAEVFARNLFLQKQINPRDYSTYRELYETLVRFLPPPDLVIYLKASVDTLKSRIALRGRDFEQTISSDYLANLNTLYDDWIDNFTLCPVLTIPSDNIDFVSNPDHLTLILQKVKDKLSGSETLSFTE